MDASADMFQDNPRNPTINGRNNDWSVLVGYIRDMFYGDETSAPESRVGIITFGETANVVLRFSERTDANEMERRLLAVRVSVTVA